MTPDIAGGPRSILDEQPANSTSVWVRHQRDAYAIDGPTHQVLDELTVLAAGVCATRAAVLSLIEAGGHWFHSRFGFADSDPVRSSPMCGHAIDAGEILVVSDTLGDKRFAEDPLVTGVARVRFCAAAPLITGDGVVLGALCVLDSAPRTFSPVQAAALSMLARQGIAHLELGRTTAALAQSERRFRSIIEEANEAYISFETDGVIREWNREAERLLGWTRDEIIGSSVVATVVPADLWERVGAALAAAPATSDASLVSTRVDATALMKSGEELPVEFTFLPLMVDGTPRINVLLHDISARRRVAVKQERLLKDEREAGVELTSQNARLRKIDARKDHDAVRRERLLKTEQEAGAELTSQNERLRELDALKDQYVSVVSHELRTPLTVIGGYLEIVLGEEIGSLTKEQRRCLEIANFSSEQLLRVVGDLLLISKMAAGHLALEMGEIDLAPMLEACIVAARPAADAKQISLRLADGLVPAITGDIGRLRQALGNIISNAIKFTEDGHVEVRLCAQGDHAVIEVTDTGTGVPASELDHLFVPFFRASTATRQAIPGTGLGLSIAKEIIEAHGGSISVESEEGSGTSFRVELPAGKVAAEN